MKLELIEEIRNSLSNIWQFNNELKTSNLQNEICYIRRLIRKEELKMKQIKIKYFYDDFFKLEKISKGDWIDLRASVNTRIEAGGFKLIPLGVAMELPEGYEAHIVPRGSTYKNFKVLQTNHMGVVDNSYKGDNDQWFFPAFALEDTFLKRGDRICQFRIVEKMPEIEFEEVVSLDNEDRGGHGSTGKK